jgi:protein TonB
MGHAALAEPPVSVESPPKVRPPATSPKVPPLFLSLIPREPVSLVKTRSATFATSVVLHSLLVVVVVLLPILAQDVLPPLAREALRVILVEPPSLTPPAPPPPPPVGGPRLAPRPLATPAPVPLDARFTAPIEVPETIAPEAPSFDLGLEGGVPGGVEGGVPGGVVGGVVGGLPPPPPPVEAPLVRVGGQLKPPKLIKQVQPVYPEVARLARVSAMVILEARVDAQGYVKSVTVLRGSPLFDEPATEAVKQWRYQPLLFNGVPTGFILTVTVSFRISEVAPQ